MSEKSTREKAREKKSTSTLPPRLPPAPLFTIRGFKISYYESDPENEEVWGFFGSKFSRVRKGVEEMLEAGARIYVNKEGGTDYTGPPSAYRTCERRTASKKRPGDVLVSYKIFEIEDVLPLFDRKIYDEFMLKVNEYIEEDKSEVKESCR